MAETTGNDSSNASSNASTSNASNASNDDDDSDDASMMRTAPGASWNAREGERARWMDDDDARRATGGAGEARGGDAGVRERDSRGDEG